MFAPDIDADAVASEPEADWQAFQCEQPVDEQEETEQPVPKRRAMMRLSSPSPIDPNRAGPSGWHQPPESSESRASEIRRILYSSDEEEEAEAKSALLIAEQEAARRREKKLEIRRAARQFIDSMAAEEGEDESEQELESDSTASDDSFIVGDDVND